MTTKIVFITGVIGLIHAAAPNPASAQLPETVLPSVEIAKIEAQEFSRALAQLKIQEVALARSVPVDDKALNLNRAQQKVLEVELTKLAEAPARLELHSLEAERDSLANDLRPGHPKMVALRTKIAKTKAAMADNQ